ncbi:MAG: hypothetical protein JZU55_02495 [Afipia sp.]|nr:hypothetical protein [Afipia sp.]
MKLTVRNVKFDHMNGAVPMICDEDGKPLPNQRSVIVSAAVDDVVKVTVEFVAGGDVEIIENS